MDPTVDLDIAGMTCASCAAGIEQRLNRLDGVEASVNYATERCRVAPPGLDRDAAVHEVIRTVEDAGYRASSPPADERGDAARPRCTTITTTRPPACSGPACWSRRVLAVPVVVMGMIPAAAVRRVGVGGARADDPGRAVGCLAVPPRGVEQPAPRRATMDTLISVGHARRLRVVASYAVSGRRRRALPRGRRRRSRCSSSPAATSRRGPSDRRAPRCARCSSSAPRTSRVLRGRRGRRACASRSSSSPSATASSCGRARRSPPTASSRTDPRRSTRRSSPARSVPVEVGPGDAVAGATVNAGGRLVVRATRVGVRHRPRPDRAARHRRADRARRRSSGSPTGSPRSSCRS